MKDATFRKKWTFGPRETALLKGVAICMLLCHHLFFIPNDGYNDWFMAGYPFWHSLAKVCKATVALFLLLSGFGLYRSSQRNSFNTAEFYKKRLLRLYPTYFLVWLIFVPLTIMFTDYTLSVAFGEHAFLKFLVNILGIQMYFGMYGYNPTWWFMTAIITMYTIFPVLYKMSKIRYCLEILAIVFAIIDMSEIWFIHSIIRQQSFAFICGMLLAKHDWLEKSAQWPRVPLLTACTTVCLIISYMRLGFENPGSPFCGDTLLAIALIILVWSIIPCRSWIFRFFALLGDHSYSIFLFHTFIIYFLLHDIIYATKNPILILSSSLLICIPIALTLDRLEAAVIQQFQKLSCNFFPKASCKDKLILSSII